MSDLRDLYQELILDHGKKPRNFGALEHPDREAEGYNPLCGDRITLHLRLAGDYIEDVRFEGSGCAISTASASLMTESLKGKTVDEARELFRTFHALVTGKEVDPELDLGKLEVFAGVSEYPVRVKCATLSWHTFEAAVDNVNDTVTTE